MLTLCSRFKSTDITYSQKLLIDPEVLVFRDVFFELLAYLSFRAPRLRYKYLEQLPMKRYPPKEEMPTTKTGFRGDLLVMKIIFKMCMKLYNADINSNIQKVSV